MLGACSHCKMLSMRFSIDSAQWPNQGRLLLFLFSDEETEALQRSSPVFLVFLEVCVYSPASPYCPPEASPSSPARLPQEDPNRLLLLYALIFLAHAMSHTIVEDTVLLFPVCFCLLQLPAQSPPKSWYLSYKWIIKLSWVFLGSDQSIIHIVRWWGPAHRQAWRPPFHSFPLPSHCLMQLCWSDGPTGTQQQTDKIIKACSSFTPDQGI